MGNGENPSNQHFLPLSKMFSKFSHKQPHNETLSICHQQMPLIWLIDRMVFNAAFNVVSVISQQPMLS